DVSEYRGVGTFDIEIEDNVVFYVDSDDKVRALDLNTKAPKAVTQEPIARSGNGFWVRKGRVVAVSNEGKFGSRYPMMLTDSNDNPQPVAGTGTKIVGTSAALGMGGSAAIAIDKTVFVAGTPRNSIGVGERLQVLGSSGWQPILNENEKPVSGCEVRTSIGFMALKVRNDAGKTVIGYATYGARISLPEATSNSTGNASASMSSPPGKRAPLKLADDNPYVTDDEKVAAVLEAYLANEAEIGPAFIQAFGEKAGRERTVATIVQGMKSAGNEVLVDDYLRTSKLVADEDRPTSLERPNENDLSVDPIAVQNALHGQWKAIRFNAQGKDLPDEVIEQLELTFANGVYVMNMGAELQTGTYNIHTAASPMTMAIQIGSGSQKGQTRNGAFKLLKDDRLLIVFATNEQDHPTRFVPDRDGNRILAVYQKVK
ncbi:MAG: TIGR03067 domain-containing protein, partial [Planctomycetota bacterium]